MSGGTSASCPIVASLINRINEERIAVGKKSVGFVNQVLYQHPEVLNDVVNGYVTHAWSKVPQMLMLSRSNPNCGTNGFTAVQGWDPVTGLGNVDSTAFIIEISKLIDIQEHRSIPPC